MLLALLQVDEVRHAGQHGGNSSSGPLPDMRFKFTSFATPQPREAAEFCVRYFGGQLLAHPSEFLAHRELAPGAEATGVRFFYTKSAWPPADGAQQQQHRRSFDIYFVNDPSKATSDRLSVPEFNQYLHDTHRFDLQENWDWYQVRSLTVPRASAPPQRTPCSHRPSSLHGRSARPCFHQLEVWGLILRPAVHAACAGLALLPVGGQRG